MLRVGLLAAFAVAVGLLLRVRKRDHLRACLLAIEALPHLRLESVVDHVSILETELQDRSFWRDSSGLRGVLRRLSELRHVVRVVQSLCALGVVTAADTQNIKHLARQQIVYSLLAIPEAAMCRIFTSLPHGAAFQATRFHWLATSRAVVFCQVDGAPEFVLRYDALL